MRFIVFVIIDCKTLKYLLATETKTGSWSTNTVHVLSWVDNIEDCTTFNHSYLFDILKDTKSSENDNIISLISFLKRKEYEIENPFADYKLLEVKITRIIEILE